MIIINIQNKVIIITGAANGIGKAIAQTVTKYNAIAVIADLDFEGAEKVAKELIEQQKESFAVYVDVTKRESVKNAVNKIIEKYGRIDVLCNNAGVCIAGLMTEIDDKDWDFTMNINLKGAFIMAAEVAKTMMERRSGRIINTGSMAALRPEYANGVYCISKAGLNMLTHVMAEELGKYNVSICAINPGYVNTELMKQTYETRGPMEGMTAEEYKQSLTNQIPFRRIPEPEEIGELVSILCDDRMYYMHGSALIFNGGRVMR
ncbi:MAG: SDR family NAD(P)-dependent oxidoreductase [Christensenellales bacterium]